MANKGKSIVDEALLESEQIEKAFEANAKEILTQTMGSEIEEMVKESLEGSNGLTEDEDDEILNLDLPDMGDEEDGDTVAVAGDVEGLELGDDLEGLEDLEGDNEELDMDVEMIDLTDADDTEVVRVFKKMGPDDEIEVVQDGGNIDIKDNETGAEYRVELGGENLEGEIDVDIDGGDLEGDDLGGEIDIDDIEGLDLDGDEIEIDDLEGGEDEEQEVVYEVELSEDGDEDVIGVDQPESEKALSDYEAEDLKTEAPRTKSKLKGRKYGNPKGINLPETRTPKFLKTMNENKVIKTNMIKVESENKELKEDYNKMVDALKQFRQKLNEVAVFNSNLTYSVRLFTEHSTTKNEKVDIIKRFDEAKTLKESKTTYKNLVKEIDKTKAPIKESIDNKINETKSSGSAQVTESKVYVHPELEKMKNLWEFNYKY